MSDKVFTTTCGYMGKPPPFPKGDIPFEEWELEKICDAEDEKGRLMVVYLWARTFKPCEVGIVALDRLHRYLSHHNPLLSLCQLPEETWSSSRMGYKKRKSTVVMLGLSLPGNKVLRLMYDVAKKSYDCSVGKATSDNKKLYRKGPPSIQHHFTLEEMIKEAQDLLDEIKIPNMTILV